MAAGVGSKETPSAELATAVVWTTEAAEIEGVIEIDVDAERSDDEAASKDAEDAIDVEVASVDDLALFDDTEDVTAVESGVYEVVIPLGVCNAAFDCTDVERSMEVVALDA